MCVHACVRACVRACVWCGVCVCVCVCVLVPLVFPRMSVYVSAQGASLSLSLVCRSNTRPQYNSVSFRSIFLPKHILKELLP